MLDHAAEQVSSSRVSWQKVDAQALPFPAAQFDIVIANHARSSSFALEDLTAAELAAPTGWRLPDDDG